MTQKERMLAGLPYKAWMDGLPEERARAQRACWEFNRLPPDARAERTALLRGLFGRTGEHLHIEEPFHCDLGYNIEVGEWFLQGDHWRQCDVCAQRRHLCGGPSGTPGRAQFGLRVRPARRHRE